MIDSNEYFAAKEAKDTADILLNKADLWFRNLEANAYLDKLKNMWMAYYGASRSFSEGHKITFAGEQGELVNININHFRNLAQNMLVMISASRPALRARATNTDYKSLVQTNLANGLLEYYMREKRLERYLRTALEYAIVLGSGFVKLDWDATSGEPYDFNEQTQSWIYPGDVKVSNLSPFDVVVDSTKESPEQDWILCRSFKNKFDLAAKFPELAQDIKDLPTKSQLYNYSFNKIEFERTDDVPVYEFYHKKTESMPEGRYLMFLSDEIVLNDFPMPYRELPIYRISAGDILGTPYGYSTLFDILPIQDGINSLFSALLTNANAFAVQNVYVPRGADVSFTQLPGGLNIIEGNSQAGKPEGLQLSASSPETFKLIDMLERSAETISGVNSVARGNPESSLKSGNALALVQSMALQFMSGLQQSYVQLIEDVGTGLVNMLRDFASVPRIAAIAGKSNKSFMKEFTGDDLSTINRVQVDLGNPLASTTAGRVQMAEQMLQMGIVTTPEQYFQVINTGRIETMTDNSNRELLLITAENEKLVGGEPILAIATDKHSIHIKEHKSVLADPDLRQDAALVERTLQHIQEHINLMKQTDPDLLTMIGEQPLGAPPAQAPGNNPPATAIQGNIPEALNSPQASSVAASPQIANVNLPTPPAPFQNNPVVAGQ